MGETVNITTENFECANCGGVMRFDIPSQRYICSSCRAEGDLETVMSHVKEYDFNLYHVREKNSVPFVGRAVCNCQNCGLEIAFEGQQISATCPMCGSTHVATIKQKSGIEPDGLVPFLIDKHTANVKFKQWVKSRWFAPSDFKMKFCQGEPKGFYLPFWTYDASVYAMYSGRGGIIKRYTDKEGKLKSKTEWHSVSGVVRTTFDDIQIAATDSEKNIERVLPYDTIHGIKPYSSSYLSGFYAELYKIRADEGFVRARSIMDRQMHHLAEQQILHRYDVAQISTIDSKYSNVTYKHVLLPIWVSSFGYKGKTYNYLVNGQTGKVSGRRPYSAVKIAIAVVTALGIAFGAYLYAEAEELGGGGDMARTPYIIGCSPSAVFCEDTEFSGILTSI